MDEKQKTRLINPNLTRIVPNMKSESKDGEITGGSETTIRHDVSGSEQTFELHGHTAADKTMLLFNRDEIQKKISEPVEIPEISPEDMETGYVSKLISKPFSHRTEEDKLKINRNFLRDAEPFTVDRLSDNIQNAPEELATGIAGLDKRITIPQRKLTFIASRPQHGKTVFMLNLLRNMCVKYTQKHFLYFSYAESRQDIEIKLINMCGEQPFPDNPEDGFTTNFDRWKHQFKTRKASELTQLSGQTLEFKGLKNFTTFASRVHVIDATYNVVDLIDSIQAFNNTLPVGGVFIDFLQAVRPDPEKIQILLSRRQQAQETTDRLMELANDTTFPIIVGAQLASPEQQVPEYDGLALKYLTGVGDPEQAANLIIGLQNYSRSEFIGSNITDHFKSRFYEQPFQKAETMPSNFKEKHPNTVLLAKVLLNKGGPEMEMELLFNKWLMVVANFQE